jgi:hypothetical protein
MTTYAVFSDRCNSTSRDADGLTLKDAKELAERLSREQNWPHYVESSDFDASYGAAYAQVMDDFFSERRAEGWTDDQIYAEWYGEEENIK